MPLGSASSVGTRDAAAPDKGVLEALPGVLH